MNDPLYNYYQKELAYLRKEGQSFAKQYPQIASMLEIGNNDCKDPHVERFLEGVAFLNARIQKNIDNDFPLITNALLDILFPHFLTPVPSMSIAKFEIDPYQLKDNFSYTVKKSTQLFAQSTEGKKCKFRTCYPVELWPVEVSYTDIKSANQFHIHPECSNASDVIQIRIKTTAAPLHNYNMRYLRFYINGNYSFANALYELLFCNVLNIAILQENEKKPFYLTQNAIEPVGFKIDENVLPFSPTVQLSFRLLMEYFVFYGKFLFFDIHLKNLNKITSHSYFDILIILNRTIENHLIIDNNTFQIGCTPVINLFEKKTEPAIIDETQGEYLLIADTRDEDTTEIHSIQSVISLNEQKKQQEIHPYFSFNHCYDNISSNLFWYARRVSSEHKELPGTDILLSIVDWRFNPKRFSKYTIYANTLSTNRHLAEKMPVHAKLYLEKKSPISKIYTLCKPTPQIDPLIDGSVLWRLISHISTNYLSFTNEQYCLEAMKELLFLYQISDRTDTGQQIHSISKMTSRCVRRLINFEDWKDICSGIEITLEFRNLELTTSSILLSSILNHFFSMYVPINSFSQLIIKKENEKGIWKKWNPMIGNQTTI